MNKKMIKLIVFSYLLILTTLVVADEPEEIQRSREKIVVVKVEQESVYQLAERVYNIDAKLLRAIEIEESGHYTSDLFFNNFNTWGSYDSAEGTWASFDNKQQSTIELARTLRFYYYDEGLETIDAISEKYCPPSPKTWAQHIKDIMAGL